LVVDVGGVDKVGGRRFDDGMEGLKEPAPIRVVLSVDNGKGKRKKLSQRVNASSGK
jgi:hypothetical protein